MNDRTGDDLSLRPHLLRAIYEWCTEKRHAPFVVARTDRDDVRIPHVTGEQMTFNISPDAVRDLTIDEAVSFTARFNGKICHVMLPVAAVVQIYARETGVGIAFQPLPPSESVISPAPARPSFRVV